LIEKGGFWKLPRPTRRELRNFCLVMAVGLGLFGLVAWYVESEAATRILGGLASLFLLSGLAHPPLTRPVFAVWMILARILGYVNTHILLALVFYTLFTAIGGVMRIFGRDPLDRAWQPELNSYWQRRETPLLPHDHYERQF